MREFIVAKADPIGSIEVDDCTIGISLRVPEVDANDLEAQSTKYFEGQATVIVDALQAHLPGGTFDAVLRELCKRKACLFRVPINS